MTGNHAQPAHSRQKPMHAETKLPVKHTAPSASGKAYLCLLFALTLLGGYLSLKFTFSTFGIDSDVSGSAMLWQGFQDQGWSFVHSWRYTPDNWLFMIVPVHFLLFAIFGPMPWVPVLVGWLYFAGSAALTGLLTARLSNSRTFGFVAFVLLICLSYSAQRFGFASYAISHNATNFSGLLSLVVLFAWLRSGRLCWMLLWLAITVTAGISDPWLIGSYTLPVLLLSLYRSVVRDLDGVLARSRYRWFSASALLAIFAVKTSAFSLLTFLPRFSFRLVSPSAMFVNAKVTAINAVRICFGFGNEIGSAISVALLFAVAAIVLGLVFLRLKHKVITSSQFSFLFIALTSIGGILLASTITTAALASQDGMRFIINVPYLLVLAVLPSVAAVWTMTKRLYQHVAAIAALILAGITCLTLYTQTRTLEFALTDHGASDFVTFAHANGLQFGYGAYWGSNANAVTWVSNGTVVIRPVRFSKASGEIILDDRMQTAPSWYTGHRKGGSSSGNFVIVSNDGEECHNVTLCISGVEAQLGVPDKSLTYDGQKILVWDHPLFSDKSMQISG
jgi:hypothetical protein